jgi:dTDP-glucose 4,6-dehydratase
MIDFIVIGGSSFFGQAFCALLSEKGHTWQSLHRPNFDLKQPGYLAVRIEGANPRYIVNFAALNMVAESWRYAADYYQTNVVATCDLVDMICAGGRGGMRLEKFVEVSTPEVYGGAGAGVVPLDENQGYSPSTPYAVSRAARDMHLALLHRQYGFPVCFSRTVNIYGPGQQLYRIIPRTIMAALTGRKLKLQGGGRSERSFIHVRDAADAVYRIAVGGVKGAVYHSSSRRPVSICHVVNMILAKMGARFDDVVEDAPERPGKDPVYLLADTKIRRALGWADKVELTRGLDEVIAWAVENNDSLRKLPLDYEHRP